MKKRATPSVTQELSEAVKPAPGRNKPKQQEKDFRIDIYKAWCKACGICVAFCPSHVFTRGEEGYSQVTDREACIGCGWCEIHCPDFAITVREKKTRAKPK